ncbi:septal ring lytic transglycosylase RlpA family protein [Telmatospirillum siberiense]|uniref:Endolytic peptidoglycan transglycosylase RlpA n=2 Tax=Telmatospirillum siberiense TaxID=382514 RepID=A0A2N3PS26_9PROT|nr:septal ring lytic transglycosylase RlpA family protein [Telmatospirillum siberiense]
MKRGGFPPARVLLLVAGCVLMSACSETKLATYAVKEAQTGQDGGGYKIGKPYQIQGVWYYPAEDYNYQETGVASWYGPDFHGKYTANGEIFDQNQVTAAHRTLPLPSFVRVTNLDNGRSLVVRVNDRGPFAHSRILDLSRRAAQLLGMEQQGTARVKVEIMADESRALAMRLKSKTDEPQVAAAPRETVQAETLPPPGSREQAKPIVNSAPPPPRQTVAEPDAQQLANQPVRTVAVKPTQMYIQAGAFQRYDNANRLSAALSGMGQTKITQVVTKGGTMFRVRMGPLPSLDAADALLEKVIASGYPEAKLVVD